MAGVRAARIEICRTLTSDAGEAGDVITLHTEDEAGERLSLLEVLGLLEFAKDSAIREAMGEDE